MKRRALAGVVAVLIASAWLFPPAATAQESGTFVGDQPQGGGLALVIWTGGSIAQMEQAAPRAISFWITAGGEFIGYIPGAASFVNADFRAAFPGDQIAADTPMLLVLAPTSAAADFDQTGNLVRNNPGLPPDTWFLIYDAPGAPAQGAELAFAADSACLSNGQAIDCEADLNVGDRVRVEGSVVDDVVAVTTLNVIEQAAQTATIEIYFLDEPRFVAGTEPFVTAVERDVEAPAVASAALAELFAGPTAEEEAAGLRFIASGATSAEITQIEGGVAHVQLVGGCDSMGSTFTVAQEIIPTLTQFQTIDFVKIYDTAGETEEPTGNVNSIPFCLEP